MGMAGKEMFLASVKEAERYGANVLMLYTGAPQNTRRKEIKDLNIEAGWEYATKAGIREIVVHAPYIINLANTVKPETFELAVEFLEKEIRRTAAMRSKILVLHPGSALDAGAEAGIAQTVRGLNMVLDANGDDVFIALETMAGKGSEPGDADVYAGYCAWIGFCPAMFYGSGGQSDGDASCLSSFLSGDRTQPQGGSLQSVIAERRAISD